jgi:hypothetical protein
VLKAELTASKVMQVSDPEPGMMRAQPPAFPPTGGGGGKLDLSGGPNLCAEQMAAARSSRAEGKRCLVIFFSQLGLVTKTLRETWCGPSRPQFMASAKKQTFFLILGANAFIYLCNTQTMHIKTKNIQQHCYVFPKNLSPWRDSNPGLLSLRPMSTGGNNFLL